jgi:hypothetical protein
VEKDNLKNYLWSIETDSELFRCPITVLNGSGRAGISWNFVDLLEKKGFFITKVDTYDQIIDKTQIFYDDEKYCYEKIKNVNFLFPKNVKISGDKIITNESRCQILIILGKDVGEN